MDEVLAIVNPNAGKGRSGRLWPQIADYLASLGVHPRAEFTGGPSDATRLAAEAVQAGVKVILSVGGDGTLNEVVNGIGPGKDVTLGAIPAGSGNDFTRALGIQPGDWQAACRKVAEKGTRSVDLGVANGRYFINISGVGFDAAVVNCVNTWGKAHFSGSFAYLASVFKTLLDFKPANIRLTLDEKETEIKKAWLVVVASGQYFGSGMWVAPEAEMDDGLFDICLLSNISKLGFLRAFPLIFSGRHLTHPAFTLHQARKVQVLADSSMLVQADGEVFATTPTEFSIMDKAINIFA